MKTCIVTAAAAVSLMTLPAAAQDYTQPSASNSQDMEELAAIVERLEAAWADGNATAWAAEFSEDADFLAPRGVRLAGRTEIENGHEGVFATIYADATIAHTNVRPRFFTPDAAIVTMDAMISPEPGAEAQGSANQPLLATMVASRSSGGWSIQYYETVYAAPDDFELPTAD